MSSTAVPPGTCLIHGPFVGSACPTCSTAVQPKPQSVNRPVGDEREGMAYHQATRERDALAEELAHLWGWPDAESVLVRLRGDRAAALATFSEPAYLKYWGASDG